MAKLKADEYEGRLVDEAKMRERYGRLVNTAATRLHGLAVQLLQKGLIAQEHEDAVQGELDAIAALLAERR